MPNPSVASPMKTQSDHAPASRSSEICTIVVLYDDDATRARAMLMCDFIVDQFWKDVELDFHWWRSDFLIDAALAAQASKAAIASDFLIVCLKQGREVSLGLESWFESWVADRGEVEGALVDMTSVRTSQEMASAVERLLREVCRRGNFEYLTSVASGENAIISGKSISDTASQKIDLILGEVRPPSHYGLNE
jgi:hypothetical protein